MTHRIRLRGPWECEILRSDAPQLSRRVELPAGWAALLADHDRATLHLRRYFHRPTGIEPGMSVWLLIDQPQGLTAAALNGKPIIGVAAVDRIEFDITSRLLDRNEFSLDATLAGQKPWHDVRLEIRSPGD